MVQGRRCQFLASGFNVVRLQWVTFGLGAMRRCPPYKKSDWSETSFWEGAQLAMWKSSIQRCLWSGPHAREVSEEVTPVPAII